MREKQGSVELLLLILQCSMSLLNRQRCLAVASAKRWWRAFYNSNFSLGATSIAPAAQANDVVASEVFVEGHSGMAANILLNLAARTDAVEGTGQASSLEQWMIGLWQRKTNLWKNWFQTTQVRSCERLKVYE
jgi:hypothetical protein